MTPSVTGTICSIIDAVSHASDLTDELPFSPLSATSSTERTADDVIIQIRSVLDSAQSDYERLIDRLPLLRIAVDPFLHEIGPRIYDAITESERVYCQRLLQPRWDELRGSMERMHDLLSIREAVDGQVDSYVAGYVDRLDARICREEMALQQTAKVAAREGICLLWSEPTRWGRKEFIYSADDLATLVDAPMAPTTDEEYIAIICSKTGSDDSSDESGTGSGVNTDAERLPSGIVGK